MTNKTIYSEERLPVVKWKELVKKSHLAAIKDSDYYLTVIELSPRKEKLCYQTKKKWEEAYAEAEESFIEDIGDFQIIDAPSHNIFTWHNDILDVQDFS